MARCAVANSVRLFFHSFNRSSTKFQSQIKSQPNWQIYQCIIPLPKPRQYPESTLFRIQADPGQLLGFLPAPDRKWRSWMRRGGYIYYILALDFGREVVCQHFGWIPQSWVSSVKRILPTSTACQETQWDRSISKTKVGVDDPSTYPSINISPSQEAQIIKHFHLFAV